MNAPGSRNDLTRNTLAVLCIVGLIAASFWILQPFVPALIWATMVVVSTWRLMLMVQERLWRRRWLAVAAMTLALLLVFVVPLALAVDAIVSNAATMAGWAQEVSTLQLPAPPEWLRQLPIVGERAAASWRDLADSGPKEVAQKLAPYAQDMTQWIARKVGGFGLMTVQFLLTVAISAVLYAYGEAAAAGLLRFGERLAGAQGRDVVRLAGQAIRGVALGVVVTAIVQSVLAGIGLAVAGIPLATLLTAVAFMLAVAQVGATPVLVAAVVWLYWRDDTAWATGLLVWAAVVGSLDNVLRPFLIRMGADLPLLLIFAGVIGGLLAFGLVGIFVGPVVLAVAYTLAGAWVAHPSTGQGERVAAAPESTGPRESGEEAEH
jgi:predicted PurR-regulated permease PerM